MAATDTKVDGCGLGPHGGVRNDVPRHTFGDTYTDEGDDGIFLGSRADEPTVLQLVGDGSRVGAAFRSIGTPDGRSTLGRRGWGAHKAAAGRGGAPPVRQQSRPASPSTRAGAAEQRATAQDTGATSPTSSVAPTEVVFGAASSLLFGMDNLNNGDPQFDPRASTRQITEEARRATGYLPGPTAAGADGAHATRLSTASGGAGAVVLDASKSKSRGGGGGATDQKQLLPTEPAQAPDPWDMPASDSSVRPSAGARRRSVTAAPFRNRLSNEQIAAIEREMTDEYRQHKRAMHKAGARASSNDHPGAVRHLRRQSLADVVTLGSFCSYWYTRQLPANVRGLRIPWMSQQAGRRVASWCAHPCSSPNCPYHGDLGDLDMLGVGRCLGPVVIGNGGDHVGHECAECHGRGTAFG